MADSILIRFVGLSEISEPVHHLCSRASAGCSVYWITQPILTAYSTLSTVYCDALIDQYACQLVRCCRAELAAQNPATVVNVEARRNAFESMPQILSSVVGKLSDRTLTYLTYGRVT